MSIWGWIILVAASVFIWKLNDWSKLKRIGSIVAVSVVCALIFGEQGENALIGGGENALKEAGKKYILQNINSPSTAKFISYVNSKNMKKVLEEKGVSLESKHDVVAIEVEATNVLGGRIRKDYVVFFINKVPVEMMDADNLNSSNIHQAISHLKAHKGW